MRQQDAFFQHHRNPYGNTGFNHFDQEHLSVFRTSGLSYYADTVNIKVSFVVDWQLQVKEMKLADENPSMNSIPENYGRANEIKDQDQGSAADQSPTVKVEKKSNYWEFRF